MENDILNIAVSGDEKNKNEIVYNNVTNAWNKLKMISSDQIELFKDESYFFGNWISK